MLQKEKNGEHDAEKRIGYFSNIENALGRYIDKVQAEKIGETTIDIKRYIDAIQEINNDTVKQIAALLMRQEE